MKYTQYHIEESPSFLTFEFYSEGPKGKVKKQVAFKSVENNPTVFNIGFGDVDENGVINDIIVTDNNDSQIVLATVALIVSKFFERYPHCYVFATGSTKARTRLYRMGITNNLYEIRKGFDLYGYIDDGWEEFQTERDYEAFLIKRKNK